MADVKWALGVPVVVVAVSAAAILFFIAGVTDGLDGLLARLLHQRTILGQYLDPVADKLLLSTVERQVDGGAMGQRQQPDRLGV